VLEEAGIEVVAQVSDDQGLSLLIWLGPEETRPAWRMHPLVCLGRRAAGRHAHWTQNSLPSGSAMVTWYSPRSSLE
jgi:hypothetical protein